MFVLIKITCGPLDHKWKGMRMNDEINREVVTIVFKATKLTADALVQAIQKYSQERSNAAERKKIEKQRQKASEVKHGKMKLKELIGKDAGAVSIEIPHDGVGDFVKIAKKYGVDFAIKKDKKTIPPTYMCFFKARDTDVLQSAFKDFVSLQNKKHEKEEFREQLRKAREEAKKQNQKTQNKSKSRKRNRNRERSL